MPALEEWLMVRARYAHDIWKINWKSGPSACFANGEHDKLFESIKKGRVTRLRSPRTAATQTRSRLHRKGAQQRRFSRKHYITLLTKKEILRLFLLFSIN